MTDLTSGRDTSDDRGGSAPSYHMDPDEFRRHGHALSEWLARYMETVGERRVMPDVEPGDIAAAIPETIGSSNWRIRSGAGAEPVTTTCFFVPFSALLLIGDSLPH